MPKLAITIRADGVQLTPGTSAAFTIEVRNLSSVVDRYRCELVGFDPTWWTVTPASLEVFPQRDDDAARSDAPPTIGRFQVTLHPPRTSAAKAGVWPFGAKVSSEHDPLDRLVEEGSVVFLPFGAIEADLRPAVVSGRIGTRTEVHVANRGNRPETVEITGTDRAARIAFDVETPRITIEPGETEVVPVRLSTGGARLVGGQETRPFSIDVRPISSATPPVSLSGTLEKPAIVPSGLPVALGGLLALGMGAFAIWAAFLRPPTLVPAAADATLAPSQVAIATVAPTPQPTPSPTLQPTPSPTPQPTPSPSERTPLPCTQSPIDVAWAGLGGGSSFLGFAVSCDVSLPDGGTTRDFEHGSMYVAPGASAAFGLKNELRDYWLSIGGPTSTLGYPTSNAQQDSNGDGGWFASFQNGRASWSPATGGTNCIGSACFVRVLPSFVLPSFIVVQP